MILIEKRIIWNEEKEDYSQRFAFSVDDFPAKQMNSATVDK